MKKLLLCLLTGCTPLTPPSQPKQEIPIITYFTPIEGVDQSRYMPSQWISLWDVYDDAYGEGEPKLRADYKEQLDKYAKKIMAQPKGRRVFFEWHFADSAWVNPQFDLIHHPDNACKDKDGNVTTYIDFNSRKRPMICPWFENGIKASAEKWKWLMTELKNRGVEIDYFSTENEQSFGTWGWVAGQAEAIDRDPRAPEFLKAVGIESAAKAMQFWLYRYDFIRMNNEANARGYKAFVEGIYKPVLEVYPNVSISDYAKYKISREWTVPDINGWPMDNEPIETISNGSDLNYLSCNQLCTVDPTNHPNDPWHNFILSLNQARAIVLSNPDKPFWSFMAERHWIQWTTDALYREHWIHLALMSTGFIFWGPDPTKEDVQIVNDIFRDVDEKVGFADRKHQVTQLIGWLDDSITTCAIANDKKVCRITKSDGTGSWEIK